MTEILQNFGAVISEYRKKHGMSQRDLAKFFGINVSLANRYERGKINVGVENMARMLDKMGYRVEIKRSCEK